MDGNEDDVVVFIEYSTNRISQIYRIFVGKKKYQFSVNMRLHKLTDFRANQDLYDVNMQLLPKASYIQISIGCLSRNVSLTCNILVCLLQIGARIDWQQTFGCLPYT